MESVDSTILTIAIPKMALSFQDSPLNLKVALTSYLISLAIFIPVSSWIAEKIGTRQIFRTAMLTFCLGSLLCGISTNLYELVIARILQGVGGAFMMPVGRLILVRVFEKHKLVKAMTTITITANLGFAVGPVLGGFITTYLNWRWIFFINLPFGLLGAFLAHKYFFNYRSSHLRPFDTVGFFLFGFGLAISTFSFDTLGEKFLSLTGQIAIFCCGIILLIGYFLHARQLKAPLLEIRLFKLRTFRIAFLGNVVARIATGGMIFMMPLYLQIAHHLTAWEAGWLLLSIAIGMVIMKPIMGKILFSFGYSHILRTNTIIIAILIYSFTLFSDPLNKTQVILCLFLYGMTLSVQYPLINSLYFANISRKRINNATTIVNTVQQLFTSTGVGVSAILLMIFAKSIFSVNEKLTTVVFHQAFLVMAIIALAGSSVFWWLKSTDGKEIIGKNVG